MTLESGVMAVKEKIVDRVAPHMRHWEMGTSGIRRMIEFLMIPPKVII